MSTCTSTVYSFYCTGTQSDAQVLTTYEHAEYVHYSYRVLKFILHEID